MAPESFEDGGVYSFASDFWALDPTPPLPGNPSPSFVNNVNSLLIKDPAERIKWEQDSKGASRKDENSLVGLRVHETVVKGTPIGRKTQTKASGRVAEEKNKDQSSAIKSVNNLRLSRITKTNLQKENEKENYRRPLPNSSEKESEVKMENTDMELDFDENTEEDVPDEPDGTNAPTYESKADEQKSSSNHIEVAATPPSVSSQHRNQRIKESPVSALESDSSKSSNKNSQVLWHPSDLSMSKEQLDVLNNKIMAIFGGNARISEKQNSKTSALRVQLASVIGLLILHSTSIEDDLANSGILGALTDGLRDRQEKVRRFSMAALGKQESMRLTAGSCLVRLARLGPQTRSIQSIMDKLSLKDVASTLIKGSLRKQQISLNLLNLSMLGSHLFSNIGRYLLPSVEERNLVPSLVSFIEQGSEVLRGKTLVFVALICKNGERWLPQFFCNARLLPTVDRLAKEKDNFIQQCLDAFLLVVASTIPNLLDAITGQIQQMMGGRRQISALMSRSAPKNNIHLFPVVLHLLGSMPFRNRVISYGHWLHLSIEIPALTILSIDQGRDDFQITLLRVLESIPEESPVILESPKIFIRGILPSLAVLYKGNIDDEDPIPMYAQKLLVMLIEFGYIKISDISDLKMVSKCFEFLLGDLTNANVNNVKLCLALASAPEMNSKLLSQLKVVRKIGNLLEFVYAKDMEDFIEPTLGLCRAFLLHSVGGRKGFVYTDPALLGDGTSEPSAQIDLHHCMRDIMDFGSNVRVSLELSASQEASIADIASECIIFLLKAAPREATTAFLTNLPKAGSILESWRKGVSHLILQRILHAIGYSCRQYLSHAMILSRSKPEITRIERIVSELKNSSTPGLANVAALVLSELQRLPRCI
ncbi:pentatricopeptide repeat-containing protein [Hibiscus syriacus]|uniref:Pentatricopeptide repeat-containing protein n=1 Tax=Hibiscus syriacus TaxID=106335 RepID=A0A6A3CEQ4_HIBSY|nr:pentatricopeptide repeat-containing protein [Hibiscus syriacus]